MKKILSRAISLLLSVLMLSASVPALFAFAAEPGKYSGVCLADGQVENSRSGVRSEYFYDFAVSRISYYVSDTALSILDRTSMDISDGVLKCKPGKSFSFGSAKCLGDDYGLESGELLFKLKQSGGKLSLGLRTSKVSATPEDRGLWLTFDGSENAAVRINSCGLEASVKLPAKLSDGVTFTVRELVGKIQISIGTEVFLSVSSEGKKIIISDGQNNVLAETENGDLPVTGYWTLYADSFDGCIDDISYTNVAYDRKVSDGAAAKNIDYSTWTATDALGRTVADNEKAGGVNQNRYVGLFYFLCWTGAGVHVNDNTKRYFDLGFEGFKSELLHGKGGEAYWSEPYFGYYRNTDSWVYRKHAYMFEAAGVDFVYLDVSNAEVFISGHTTLFDTWLQIRREGGHTPQIVFFNGDDPKTFESNMEKLFGTVYSEDNWDKYSELFFTWEGKPLIFGNISGVSSQMAQKINDKFNVRGSWAWCDKDGYWSWLQEYGYSNNKKEYTMTAGGWGRNSDGKYESLSVTLGHHASTSKGRSYVLGQMPKTDNEMGYTQIETSAQGLCFESQFEAVSSLIEKNISPDDPFVLMITGWNEWIAGCIMRDQKDTFAGGRYKYYYVDEFNPEYSRDAEPMRNYNGYGFGDNYYYQMADYIRQFKGIGKAPTADDQKTVDIYDIKSWDGIEMKYDDNIGDTEWRNTISYDADHRYINGTGRNDFDCAKVSQDSKYLYFLVKCADDIIIDNKSNWMNLYIDVNGTSTDGFCGFDYVLNRRRDSFAVTVDKISGDGKSSEEIGAALYFIDGQYMTVMLDKSLLGIDGKLDSMIFKWADNSTDVFDAMEFMDLGDAAPNDRYGFLYLCDECGQYSGVNIPEFDLSEVAAVGDKGQRGITAGERNTGGGVIMQPTDMTFDFDSQDAGRSITDTVLKDYFELAVGTSSSSARIQTYGQGNSVYMTGYCDLRTWDDITGAYTVSLDVETVDFGNAAVYIRGEMPGAFTKYNPAHSRAAGQDVTQAFAYYEWDWYAENGGRSGGSSVAGSGLGVYPGESGIEIKIKRYAEDGLTVASSSKTLPYPNGFSVSDGFFNLKFEDDGERIDIYLDGDLFAYVMLEDPGKVYESDGTGQEYYGFATLYTPDGKTQLKVADTRLNSSGSQLAITTRNQTIRYDNIHIAYMAECPENGAEVRTVITAAEGSPAYTPDNSVYAEYLANKSENTDETTADDVDITTVADSNEVTSTGAEDGSGCGSALSLVTLSTVIPFAITILRKRKITDNEE